MPPSSNFNTLGILAGSGNLPKEVIASARKSGRNLFVIGFENITEPNLLANVPHATLPIGKVGEAIRLLKNANVDALIMAGRVGRPDFSSLKPDVTGMKLMATLIRLGKGGDDAVFSAIIQFIEKRSIPVIGIDSALPELVMEEAILTKTKPDKQAQSDIALGVSIARDIGRLDIGQAVIVQRGLVLGVEGAEGTDKLISRCKELKQQGAGGVLVKMKKPNQDSRVDLPSIGVHTVENAHASGLRGIAMEAGGSLVIDRAAVIKRADELGIFVQGVSAK